MTIGAVSGTSSALTAKPLSMEVFMKVLITQLQYQDPLKPMDNQQFMAQIAQFTSLQQTQDANDKLGTLISNQSALQSVGLIGRTIDFAAQDGSTVTGQVTALALSQGDTQITVLTQAGKTLSLNLAQITAVR